MIGVVIMRWEGLTEIEIIENLEYRIKTIQKWLQKFKNPMKYWQINSIHMYCII